MRTLAGALLMVVLGACAAPRTLDEEPESEPESSVLGTILLYLPNRVLDVAEIVRAGVNVGPGIGVDAEVTKLVGARAMTRTSAGVGYEGLRRIPINLSSEHYVGVGPLTPEASAGPQWYRGPADVRAEVHLLLVGVHAAVDTFAILDFVVGLVGLDPEDDDLSF